MKLSKHEPRDEMSTIPLRISPEHRASLLRRPEFRRRDVVDLFHEATQYVQGRLVIPDRETAIAILLSKAAFSRSPITGLAS